MIGQNLDALDIVQCLDEIAGALEVGIYVRDARNEDMADPDRDLVVGEPPQCFKDVLVAVGRELLVLDRIDVLDIGQHEIGRRHETLEVRIPGLLRRVGSKRGVEAGIDAALVGLLEELRHEGNLHKCFATRYCDAAFGSPVGAVAFRLVQKLVCFHQGSAIELPGIRVVAIAAAHRAALKEDEEPDAWTICRSERFD